MVVEKDEELCTDIHRLNFHGKDKMVEVEALSHTSPFHWKITPKRIKYSAFIKMLDGYWDGIEAGDIVDR